MSLAAVTAAATQAGCAETSSQAPPAFMPQHDAAHAHPAASAPALQQQQQQQQSRGPHAAAMVLSTSMGLNVVQFSAAGQPELLMQPDLLMRPGTSQQQPAQQLPAASAELGRPGTSQDLGLWPAPQSAGSLHVLSGLAIDKSPDSMPHVAA